MHPYGTSIVTVTEVVAAKFCVMLVLRIRSSFLHSIQINTTVLTAYSVAQFKRNF